MLSYEELYEKYATDVLRVSYFYLGDRQRAEDVCQDVFVRLMTNAPDLQEVTADQICGRVLLVVPKGGTASLWLRQLLQ